MNKEQAQKENFEKHCNDCGLNKEDYNKEIKFKGEIYNLIGFRLRSKKYPLLVKSKRNGKMYKMPITLF